MIAEIDDKRLFVGEGMQITNNTIVPLKNEVPGSLSYSDFHQKGHFWFFGGTRTGKARLLETMILQDIRRGYSTVVIDPRGDFGLLTSIIQVATEEGRLDEFQVITPIGGIINMAQNNIFIDRLENEKRVILVVHPGLHMMCSSVSALGKLIVFTIQSYVERLLSSGRKVPVPLSLFINEAQLMLYQGIDRLFSMAGGTNVCVHGFCQSAAQIYDFVGRDYAKTILDTSDTKLLMHAVDLDTVEFVADWKPHDVMALNAREF